MKILYIAACAYPGDSAYATRIEGLCDVLNKAGHETFILVDYSKDSVGRRRYRESLVISSAKHIYAERSLSDKVLAYSRMIYNLKKIVKENHFDCVIISSIYMRANAILNILRKKRIPVILESCEWFDTYNWKKGEKSYEYKKFLKAWNDIFPHVDGVVAISRMLEQHYLESVQHVLRIPTVMEVKQHPYRTEVSDNAVKLIFTGSIAWGKDRLLELIKAINTINDSRLQLDVYGPSKDEVVSQLGEDKYLLEKLTDTVRIHGRIDHELVEKKCMESDFGVIIRPERRQSDAGFPTKLAEYMTVGTPVIANDTGDIGLYVKNGYNGFCLPRSIKDSDVVDVLKYILTLSIDERMMLRKNARSMAEKSFDCACYVDELNKMVYKVTS